jgi:hypothetical protein
MLAVIVGFLQPTGEIVVEVFGVLDAQQVDDAGILLLDFLDAAMFQASAQNEHDIEPVLADGHRRKHRTDLEENSCLRRRNHDLAASLDQITKHPEELDNWRRFVIEQLVYRELSTRMGLIAIFELATATWAGPKRFRFGFSGL